MKYSLADLRSFCDAELIPESAKSCIVDSVITDSRNAVLTVGALFIAIEGERNDGHQYVMEMYEKGVRNFLVSQRDLISQLPADASILVVENTVLALQEIARFHRSRFSIPVISVTGSNGKTIVKEWLFQLLSPFMKVLRSPKSYNSQIGVPLSVLALDENYDIAVFEAGISKPDEMQHLADIIQADTVIFTNIGTAHDENFIHVNQKVGEKLKLASKSSKLIYCADHHLIRERILQSGIDKVLQLCSWSKTIDSDLKIIDVKNTDAMHHSLVEANFNGDLVTLELPFNDQASVENAMHCWLLMLDMGFSQNQIQLAFKKIQSVEMRLEMVQGINNCILVNDFYNSDLTSLQIALDYISHQSASKKRCIILSDILQSGKPPRILYQEVADLVEKYNIERIIGIGSEISAHGTLFSAKSEFYKDTDDFFSAFRPDFFSDEIILLKGARIFRFERIAKLLVRKSHVTRLEINLNALVDNYNFFRARLNKTTGVIAMVKAFAYGSGAVEIARALEFNHVNYLAVAYADEGVALRMAGINVPVIVMNPEKRSFYQMIKYNLEPEIYSIRILEDFAEFINSDADFNAPFLIHLKIDTGMHRLGFMPAELPSLIDLLIREKDQLKVASVFSHFTSSEDAVDDNYSRRQAEILSEAHSLIEKSFNYKIAKHICNSNGILRFPEYHFDFARLGIGLYGETADAIVNNQLRQVVTFRTKISQIRYIAAGESVGYSRHSVSEKPRLIATIPVGYADGLDRRLSDGNGEFVVRGITVKTVGLICMDMCMLDVSEVPEVTEDDSVIIFGDSMPLHNYARASGRIVYEALTAISERVNRLYIKE